MAENKILNTRIQLKYDTLANWTDKNPTLLAGELAVVSLGNSHTTTTPDNGTHPILFKVGPGAFNSLPFASALAADVYGWAKKENPDWNDFSTIPVAKLPTEAIDTDNNTTYAFEIVGGALQVTEIPHVKGVAGTPIITTYDFVTPEELKEVKDLIPTDLGVMSIVGEDAIKVAGDTDAVVSLVIDTSGNVTLSQSTAGLKADIDLSEYRKIADDEDTKYGLEYDADEKVIKLVANGGKDSIDASDFIVDGMLQSVTADQENNTLTFAWNTDAGVSTTTVNLSEIADIYTGDSTDDITVAVSNTNVITATLTDAAKAQFAPAGDYKTKQTAYSNNGSTIQTVTAVSQNANGEVAVTYEEIAFPAPPEVGDGMLVITTEENVLTGSGQFSANQTEETTIEIAVASKGIDTGKIADRAVGAEQTKAFRENDGSSEEVWVFYCGSASDLV